MTDPIEPFPPIGPWGPRSSKQTSATAALQSTAGSVTRVCPNPLAHERAANVRDCAPIDPVVRTTPPGVCRWCDGVTPTCPDQYGHAAQAMDELRHAGLTPGEVVRVVTLRSFGHRCCLLTCHLPIGTPTHLIQTGVSL